MYATQLLVLFLGPFLQACYCLQSVSYNFDDAQLFFDLSTYNFAKGRAEVYEYTLTAREGHVISVYLFQNNVKQYTIEAFGGENDQGTPLQVNIPTNVDFMETPVPIISSGRKMFIRVKADQSDPNLKVDFQAVATDYTQPDECANMVMTVNKVDQNRVSVKFLTNQGRTCYYLIHANDPTNNPLLSQYIVSNPDEFDKFYLFKGLLQNDNHQLIKNDVSTWASDKYIIVWPVETLDLAFAFTFLGNLDLNLGVAPYTSGHFMTNDFYQDAYPNLAAALTQKFTLNLAPPMTSIQVSFIRLMGSSSVTVNTYSNGKQLSTTPYFPAQMFGHFNVTYGCDVLELIYTTDNRNLATGSGFYALYDDATKYSEQETKAPIQTTLNTKSTVSGITATKYSQTSLSTSAPVTELTQSSFSVKIATSTSVTQTIAQTVSLLPSTESIHTSTQSSLNTNTQDATRSSTTTKPPSASSQPSQTTTNLSGSIKVTSVLLTLFFIYL